MSTTPSRAAVISNGPGRSPGAGWRAARGARRAVMLGMSLRRGAAGALFVALATAAGCGGGGGQNEGGDRPPAGPPPVQRRAPTASEADAIRWTVARLERAMAHSDAREICRLYTADARESQVQSYTSCDTATRSDLEAEKPPRLTVGRIEVTNARGEPGALEASAAVTSTVPGRRPFVVDAVLVREGGSWHVDDGVLDYLLEPSAESGPGGDEPGEE